MKKTRSIKRLFLYIEDPLIPRNYKGGYTRVKAISDDEKHYFEFNVDQDNYGQSLKELCEKFEKFCVDECGFDDDNYCEIHSTFDSHKVIHIHGYRGEFYDDNLDRLLSCCSWATRYTMESTYTFDRSHLRQQDSKYSRPPTFEEYLSAHDYDQSNEPYAAKNLYPVFKSEVEKRNFSEDELNNTVDFIKNNIYLIHKSKARRFIWGISDFLSEKFDLKIYPDDYFDLKIDESTGDYISDNLFALETAVYRLYKYDKKRLKLLRKRYGKEENDYFKKAVKTLKWYGE